MVSLKVMPQNAYLCKTCAYAVYAIKWYTYRHLVVDRSYPMLPSSSLLDTASVVFPLIVIPLIPILRLTLATPALLALPGRI